MGILALAMWLRTSRIEWNDNLMSIVDELLSNKSLKNGQKFRVQWLWKLDRILKTSRDLYFNGYLNNLEWPMSAMTNVSQWVSIRLFRETLIEWDSHSHSAQEWDHWTIFPGNGFINTYAVFAENYGTIIDSWKRIKICIAFYRTQKFNNHIRGCLIKTNKWVYT